LIGAIALPKERRRLAHLNGLADAFAPLRAVPRGKGVVLPKPLSVAGHDHIIAARTATRA
jgi:hypothetical protein